MDELIIGILVICVIGWLYISRLWNNIQIPKKTTVTYKEKGSGKIKQVKMRSDNDLQIAKQLKNNPNIETYHVVSEYWDDGWRTTFHQGNEEIYEDPNFFK